MDAMLYFKSYSVGGRTLISAVELQGVIEAAGVVKRMAS